MNTIKEFSLFPEHFPEAWASDWGEDRYGIWMAFTYRGVRQGFRWIPPGKFLMGSPESEIDRYDNEVQHEVILTNGYWLGETVCTQALWKSVMGNNPGEFKGEQNPVDNVSWDDAMVFIGKLNKLKPALKLCLPTEAEWEYGCRAGTSTAFYFGDNITPEQVNYDGNYPYSGGNKGEYREKTVPVKSFPCNQFGLYEMHGNVWEWCKDWFGDYSTKNVVNPIGKSSGVGRVLRGGSWRSHGEGVRSAYRGGNTPDDRNRSIGFRLSRGQDRQAGKA